MAGVLSSIPIEKLSGRDNYNNWEFAMKAYLQHEGLWSQIGQEIADTTPADQKIVQEEKNVRAKAKIIMCVHSSIYVHIRNLDTAKQVWDKLKQVFQDDGLYRRVTLMRKLITTKLEDCKSMEEFVSAIETNAQMLNNINFAISQEWVGTFLLAGLPERFKPMIMAMESSGQNITAEFVKSKLLQEGSESASNEKSALSAKSNKRFSKSRQSRCYNCNELGHYANKCPKSKSSKKSNSTEKNGLLTVFAANDFKSSDEWIIDSGASSHMTHTKENFCSTSEATSNIVRVANNQTMTVNGAGSCELEIDVNNKTKIVSVDAIFVPELSTNLLSVSQIAKRKKKLIFDEKGCKIIDVKTNQLVATASLHGDLYKLNLAKSQEHSALTIKNDNYELWHRRYGHINNKYLQQILKQKNLDFCANGDGCKICLQGKQTKISFPTSQTKSSEKLELVHGDLCGPIEQESLGGKKYIFLLTDDFSHKSFVYFLKHKNEVFQVFVKFKAQVENETGCRIKTFRSDNGGEFCNVEFVELFDKSGIKHETTIPYTPQQNGVSERMNRTVIEKARCMLFDSQLPKKFWAEAVNAAVHVLNRSPTSVLNGQIPEEVWSNKKINTNYFRVFGSRAMVHVAKVKRKKFDPVSEEQVMVGYGDTQKGYRVYNKQSGTVSVSRNIVFDESQNMKSNDIDVNEWNDSVFMPLCNEITSKMTTSHGNANSDQMGEDNRQTIDDSLVCDPNVEDDVENSDASTEYFFSDDSTDTINNVDDEDFVPDKSVQVVDGFVRRSNRTPKPRINDDFVYATETMGVDDPMTVEEAKKRNDWIHWKKAMDEELSSIVENNTWSLINRPANCKPIHSRWIFKTKHVQDGTTRYKARLVIKGCAQRHGIDYEETFAPVVKYNSIRYLLAMAVEHNMEIEQLDAVTAFLQGELKENVFMFQPEHYNDGTDKICKLNRAMYGLKQAGRAWNEKLDTAIRDIGLVRSKADPCIYFKLDKKSFIIIAIYVDDILIFSTNKNDSSIIKKELCARFKMKDIGDVKSILGFRITRDRNNGILLLDQEDYIKKILERFNMGECNPVSTPVDVNVKLDKSMSPKTEKERNEMKSVPYQEAVGSLLYAAQGTRPDISYAVNLVSRYSKDPGVQHWNAVKRIFRYLKGTISAKIQYLKSRDPKVTGFSDSDWASDIDGRKSITGFVFTKCGGAITWSTRKQQTVALSTTEAEYMALSAATQEAMWLKKLDDEFGGKSKMTIFCDNISANVLTKNESYHSRTKHIDVKHHFIREKVENSVIQVIYLCTDDMVADVLTKGLPRDKHNIHSMRMGVQI